MESIPYNPPIYSVQLLTRSSVLLMVIVHTTLIVSVQGQSLILPEPEVKDPFKDNPKWEEFQLMQKERMETLKTLVNNVWKLVDSNPFPRSTTHLRDAFVRFHVPEFLNFFDEPNARLQAGSPFPFINTAIGFQTVSSLLSSSISASKDDMIPLRLQWMKIHEMAQVIHSRFNKSTYAILNYEDGVEEMLFASEGEVFTLWNSTTTLTSETPNGKTINQLAALVDKEILSNDAGHHVMRRLLTLLSTMRQSFVDTHEHVNYFCYGNNEFGVIPGLFDIIPDAGLYLVMMDMKKLILDVYLLAFNTFFNSDRIKPKNTMVQREAIWDEMVNRINRKINFPYLEGLGWPRPAGPIIFKCDIPPKDILGNSGQWGRNITTGIRPNASHTFAYGPPAGPLKPNLTVGYLDDRHAIMNAVGFDGAFQGYIESELALSQNFSCRETCPVFKSLTKICDGTSKHCPLFRKSHCQSLNSSDDCMEKNACPSHAMKCKRTGREVTMCFSKEPGKLYDWISFNGRIIRRSNFNPTDEEATADPDMNESPPACPGRNVTTALERWSMENGIILNTPRYCELCLCTCMTPFNPNDQHYFDIRPVVSDVKNGMIVSAVRFAKENNVVRLSLEEGRPLMKGSFDEKTLKWIQPEPILDKHDMSKLVPVGISGFMKFNFDLIVGKPGTVVTGVRFKFFNEAKTIGIEIQVTPITWPVEDSTKISLTPSAAEWLPSTDHQNPREPLIFVNPGDPAIQRGPSMPDSVLNSYVEFTTSSYETDLAQTVIPFFDAQPVFYYEGRRWLRGAGIMHKGKPGSGGFITPMIVPATPYTTVQHHPSPPL